MKKLMIAAAVAAMIGGAYADLAYDFSASVKTTKAKAGSSTTKTIQVGQDRSDNWWYEDAVFTTNAKDSNYRDYGTYEKVVKFDANGVGTLQASKLDNDGKASLATDLIDYSDQIDPATGVTYGLPEIYKGKKKWCQKWNYKVAGTCVRAKGSEKITTSYTMTNNCCTSAIAPTAPETWAEDDAYIGDLTFLTFYRFGASFGSKCTNVEAVGYIGEGVGTTEYTTIPSFAIAGQGAWGTLKASDKTTAEGLKTLSGNIVGIWYEAQCEVCCGADASSLAYSCDLAEHNVDGYTDIDGIAGDDTAMGLTDIYHEDQWGTAAFGTFTIKFNAKNSSDLDLL